MNEIDEGDLIFSFAPPFIPVRFDDKQTHGMSHVMKSVDFIVTSPQQTWLIEVKDPENRNIPSDDRPQQKENFLIKIRSGRLFSEELAPKLKDTLLYLTLQNRAPANEIRYFVCIAIEAFDEAMLLSLQDQLKKELNLWPGPFKKDWKSQFDILVFNIEAWNQNLEPHSVRRKT